MAETELTPDELNALPIFPLPNMVLFPGSLVPLHLFEPRYRALVEHCMGEGPEVMAVARLKAGWRPDYAGQPALHRHAGVGRIVAHRLNDDGTHDIILRGEAVVTLEELPDEGLPFRRARAQVFPDVNESELGAGEAMALRACATTVATMVRRRSADFSFDFPDGATTGLIADVMAHVLCNNPDERQSLLEERSVPARVAAVIDVAGRVIAQLNATEDMGPRGAAS